MNDEIRSTQNTRRAATGVLLLLLAIPGVATAQCTVCVSSGGNAAEATALQSTLSSLGYNVIQTLNPTVEACEVFVVHPGQGAGGSGPAGLLPWVQAGNGVVQISDWGPDLMANSWKSVAADSPQTVEILDGSHPITSGLPATWTSLGFWTHSGGDYLGWVTADPILARVGGEDGALSARAEGNGRLVYIGWNVYGSVATAEDVEVLERSIDWAGQCTLCGNGQLDAGEQCDDGNTDDGDCCSSACVFETEGCSDGDACTIGDLCDGAGTCVPGGPLDCSDGDLCTQDSCDPGTGCANLGEPATTCETGFEAGLLMVKEKKPGKERIIAKFLKGPQLSQTDFGDPVSSTTEYSLCMYDQSGGLVGALEVDRAGEPCGSGDCWKSLGKDPPDGKGYAYKDGDTNSDGVLVMKLKGGEAGRSKALIKAKNDADDGQVAMPTGIAAGLSGGSSATMQLHASDGVCLSLELTDVVRDTGDQFKAKR